MTERKGEAKQTKTKNKNYSGKKNFVEFVAKFIFEANQTIYTKVMWMLLHGCHCAGGVGVRGVNGGVSYKQSTTLR